MEPKVVVILINKWNTELKGKSTKEYWWGMHEVIAILTIQAENDTVNLMVEPLSAKIFTMRNKNTSSGINGCSEQILLTNFTLSKFCWNYLLSANFAETIYFQQSLLKVSFTFSKVCWKDLLLSAKFAESIFYFQQILLKVLPARYRYWKK